MDGSKSSTEVELGLFSTDELFSMISLSDKFMSLIQGKRQRNAKVENASFSCALIAELRTVKTKKEKCVATDDILQAHVPYLLSTFFDEFLS